MSSVNFKRSISRMSRSAQASRAAVTEPGVKRARFKVTVLKDVSFNGRPGDINEDRIFRHVGIDTRDNEDLDGCFIMTINDLVFTEQMLLCLEKVRALGVEWSLEMGDLCIVLG